MKYNSGARTEIIERLVPCKPGRVLDIGCNSGSTLRALAQVWGDFAHVGVDLVQPSGAPEKNITLLKQDIFEMHHSVFGKFDYILALDVIEHIYNTDDFLERCKSLLAEGGRLILSVPNIRFLPALMTIVFKKDFPEHDAGIFDKTHIRHFTRSKILRVLSERGFDVMICEGINSLTSVQPNLMRSVAVAIATLPLQIIDRESLFQQHYLVCGVK